ncbi:hypothetical protein VUJ46_05565 [Chryseobacterium sp. MYb264]|uniref:tetratricopeptide repeat protein n=1 Tax=Chryseobacterium sp. MYb264 TaxID=2745153 RepID=UPI002E1264E9|nr:hypothetical protein VUJ46_05565 [Chryseobacterium sp. MYb264]
MFPRQTLTKLAVIFFLLILSSYKSQDYSFFPETVKQTAEYYDRGEQVKAMEYNFNALARYKKEKDKEGMSTVYLNIGFLTFSYNQLTESIGYLDKAKEQIRESGSDDPLLQARLYSEYAKNYSRLGMVSRSNLTFDKAIAYAEKVTNEKQRDYMLFYCYIWKRVNFLSDKDSLKSIDRKVVNIMPGGITYTKMADYFIEDKANLDSARFYLDKAMQAPDKDMIGVKAMTLFSYGNLYNALQENEKSSHYYLQALELFKKVKLKNQIRAVYDSLAAHYSRAGDAASSKLYLEKYKIINDSIKREEKLAVDRVVDNLSKEDALDAKKDRYTAYFVIVALIIVFGLFMYIRGRINLLKHLEKDRLLEEKTLRVLKLEKQTSHSFDKVAEMAKNNDPFFLVRFKEVYPEFYENLLQKYPFLTDNDIRLCAYIRLNLSNKEIATFKNLTVRSVETTKYRLKKKLGLDADSNLNTWISEL